MIDSSASSTTSPITDDLPPTATLQRRQPLSAAPEIPHFGVATRERIEINRSFTGYEHRVPQQTDIPSEPVAVCNENSGLDFYTNFEHPENSGFAGGVAQMWTDYAGNIRNDFNLLASGSQTYSGNCDHCRADQLLGGTKISNDILALW